MNEADKQRVQAFLNKWQGSEGNERANYQTFFGDLCVALGVEGPPPKGSVAGDPYCFDKDIKFYSEKGESTRFADFYKQGHFLIEAKQGSSASGKGHGKRGTKAYRDAMQKAFYQAKSYANNRMLGELPPFLITCDIGSHFEIWQGFSGEYGSYGAREQVNLADLMQPEIFDRFVKIFTDPQGLNPEKYRARVTREVAADLATLSKWLEEQGHQPQETANFLMRCIFTMFAEDVELLPGEVFTKALRDRWIDNPKDFKPEIESLWQTMNTGGKFGFEKILRFNGSFFEDATAFELPKEQLEVLYAAAAKDWSQVEPAIFGTLLERALEKKERSRLGAHYTPRSYVERLVRPVVMEPLRQEWDEIELEVKRLLETAPGKDEPTKAQRNKAEKEIREFLAKLRQLKILDPACGTGNFLYVSMDLLKGLEQEVMKRLLDVAGQVQLNVLEQINPSQFLGIEINPRAAAIAELVIWIGYLQWYFKRYGNAEPPEPVLQAFGNIECRDAVLAYDGKEEDIDPKTGEVRTRWGGKMMTHPVTGEEVPDPSDRIPIYRYINPRPAEWPEADYVVSNPPFIGNKRMRQRLGDGYVYALRTIHKDIPEGCDFVMYWWNQSAKLIFTGNLLSFGLITTNSITQTFNRRVLQKYLSNKKPLSLSFAIPDHPWIDSEEGASVRIAMTVAQLGKDDGTLATVSKEQESEDGVSIAFLTLKRGIINADLSIGSDIISAHKLRANSSISGQGVIVLGEGFQLTENEYLNFIKKEPSAQNFIKKYRNGKDITNKSRNLRIIDLYGFTETKLKDYPYTYQRIYDRVRPKRLEMKEKSRRENWWLFGRSNQEIRNAISGLENYIITCRTAKHRVFLFIASDVLPDAKLIAFGLDDPFYLGVLSSKIHVDWAKKSGAWLGVGNDSNYNHSECFGKFPFPDPTPQQKQKIRKLGELLDAHRKQVQANHPDITITGMYNLLEKLRAGEPLTDKDREYNHKALVSTLKQIHDDLDRAVFAAYGWDDLIPLLDPPLAPPSKRGESESPPSQGGLGGSLDEIILDRLVALNAERAEEERNGLIRWLRPEYQAPEEQAHQTTLEGVIPEAETVVEPVEQQKWPTKPKDQLAAIRDLLRTTPGEWTVKQIAAQFKGRTTQKKLDAITENLERLEWFGMVFSEKKDSITYWQYTELQQVS